MADPAQPPSQAPRAALSVSMLSALLKSTIEDAFPHVAVQGEISSPKEHGSGHVYFTLKDSVSSIDAVCWRGQAAQIKSFIEHGKHVVCTGRLTSYAARSKYQMVISDVQALGAGHLHLLLEKRKTLLQQAGYFNAGRKRPLPTFPKGIVIITSPTGAVIQDMLHRIAARYPCPLWLLPVNVQGPKALPDILGAFHFIKKSNLKKTADLVILARGGGSFEELFVFNEEEIVKSIAACPVPVVTAIGHETDTTLSDHASDMRAPTPTAAAELATPSKDSLLAHLQDSQKKLKISFFRMLKDLSTKISWKTTKLSKHKEAINFLEQTLDGLTDRLNRRSEITTPYKTTLLNLFQRLKEPKQHLQRRRESFCFLEKKLKALRKQCYQASEQKLFHVSALLENLSYKKTLKRGFCLAFTSNKHSLVTTVKSAPLKEVFSLQFSDGTVDVKQTEKP